MKHTVYFCSVSWPELGGLTRKLSRDGIAPLLLLFSIFLSDCADELDERDESDICDDRSLALLLREDRRCRLASRSAASLRNR